MVGFALAGFVAGDGYFLSTRRLPAYADGSERRRFVFGATVASRDRPVLEALQRFLGVGSINDQPPRRAAWQPTSAFQVGSHRQLHAAVIPFAEQFLLTSQKRRQFERWRDDLYAHEAAHPSRWGCGPSTCSVEACDRPVRGQGVCRSHYYVLTGH